MAEQKNERVVLGKEIPVRFSYAYVFEARESDDEPDENGVKKKFFSTMVLIDKKDTKSLEMIKAAVAGVINEKFKGKSTNLKLPLRDGDEEWEEKGEYLKGHYFFNCKSKLKPNVVGTKQDEFTGKLAALDASEFKSGDYGRVSVYFYDFNGKSKGVAAGLGNIQKTKDGEPLGSARSADDDFGGLEEGFED